MSDKIKIGTSAEIQVSVSVNKSNYLAPVTGSEQASDHSSCAQSQNTKQRPSPPHVFMRRVHHVIVFSALMRRVGATETPLTDTSSDLIFTFRDRRHVYPAGCSLVR